MLRLLAAVIFAAAAACGSAANVPSDQVSTVVRELKQGQVVDGVPCLKEDLPPVHLHIHLAVLLDAVPVTVPAGIGVGRPWGYGPPGFIATGTCFAWIHTHDTTGVVHVFTEVGTSFTLGQLFEVWGRPLSASGALGYTGRVAVLVGGQPLAGDPRRIPLTSFADIVIELGRPPATPPPPFDFGTMTR